jgi:predicted lipid-binding transport protein (Tim44 family)
MDDCLHLAFPGLSARVLESFMGASGSFPIDIVLFGMIAAFLVLRLRSILGKRQGFERSPEAAATPMRPAGAAAPIVDAVAEPATQRTLPDPNSASGLVLARMQQIEPGFNPLAFLGGAEAAFHIIVNAFAAGDRVTLRPLLSDDTYQAFEGAIAGRETAHETQHTEIRAINATSIEAASLRDRLASVTVRFNTDQVNVTNGADGNPVHGTDAVTEMTDLWTFERELATPDPTWRLVAARSA